jgi:hypothetical protein
MMATVMRRRDMVLRGGDCGMAVSPFSRPPMTLRIKSLRPIYAIVGFGIAVAARLDWIGLGSLVDVRWWLLTAGAGLLRARMA